MISQGLGVDEESSRLEVLQALPFFSLKRQLKKVSEERGQREWYRHHDLEVKSLWFQQQGLSAGDDGPQRKTRSRTSLSVQNKGLVFIWSFRAVISAGKKNIKTEDSVNSESFVFQVRLFKQSHKKIQNKRKSRKGGKNYKGRVISMAQPALKTVTENAY